MSRRQTESRDEYCEERCEPVRWKLPPLGGSSSHCTCLTQRQRKVLINALGRAWLDADRVARESEALREEFSKDKEDYTEIRGKVEKIPIYK